MPFDPTTAKLVTAPSGGFDPSTAKLVSGPPPEKTDTWKDFTSGFDPAKNPQMPAKDFHAQLDKLTNFTHSMGEKNLLLNLGRAAVNGNLKKFIENPQLIHTSGKDISAAVKKGLMGVVQQAKTDPTGAVRGILQGLMADPEMLLLGGVEGGLVRRTLLGAAGGAAFGGGSSAAGNLAQGPKVDVAGAAGAAAGGAELGGVLGAVGGRVKPKGPVAPPDATEVLEPEAGKPPALPAPRPQPITDRRALLTGQVDPLAGREVVPPSRRLPAPAVERPPIQVGGTPRNSTGDIPTYSAGDTLAAAHKELLDSGGTTLRTLERLPQNKPLLGRQQIEGELRRQDVSAHEKAVVQQALEALPGEKIPAKALVNQVRLQTGQFDLTPEETDEYADYGLGDIDRAEKQTDYWDEEADGPAGESPNPATTTKWKLPFAVPHENHFNDSHMLGWTRSFMENGQRHVVEIQSDLAQKGQKELSPEERVQQTGLLGNAQELVQRLQEHLQRVPEESRDSREVRQSRRQLEDMQLRVQELKKRLASSVPQEHLRSATQNWPRRLIQEELSRAGREGHESIRFASPDTTAAVEGWPEQEGGYAPEHQTIYNRYSREIVPYLKQLGGKEVTDEHGHTWYEVPTRKGLPPRQYGRIDPDLLKKVAVAGAGGLALQHLLHDKHFTTFLEGATLGELAYLGAGKLMASGGLKPYEGPRIGEHLDRMDADLAKQQAGMEALVRKLKTQIPPERRTVVRQALEGHKVLLTPQEKEAALAIRQFYNTYQERAKAAGVFDEGRENYINHVWDFGGQATRAFGGALKTSSPFAKARTFGTIEEGKAAGLTPLTEDPMELMRIYSNSMGRAIAGKNLVAALKDAKGADGQALLQSSATAPRNYVSVSLSALRPYRVHPDIAPSLRMLESPDLGPLRGVSKASQAAKRIKILGTFMHAKSLAESRLASINTGLNPVKMALAPLQVMMEAVSLARGSHEALRQLREDGEGPLVDNALKYGVKLNLRPDESSIEDENSGAYSMMRETQAYLDSHLPLAGKVAGDFIQINHAVDGITIGKLQTGWKLITFNEKYNELIRNGVEQDKAGETAASYTNTMFGGLNWRKMAEDARTTLGRDVSMAMLHPKSRALTQLVLFAPDWTVSTIKGWVAAARSSGSAKDNLTGLFTPKTLGDLHRVALVRSAFWYILIGDAINHKMTGHHIWQNQNPLRIDLGDGDEMQLAKHFTDFPVMVMNTRQEVLNKLNYPVSEPLALLQNRQYLSASGQAPTIWQPGDTTAQKVGKGLQHVVKSALPISTQQQTVGQALASISGVPIIHHKRR